MHSNSIETTEFSLTRSEYFKILVESRIRRYWYLYMLVIGSGIFLITRIERDSPEIFMAIGALIYVPIIFIYLLYWAYSEKNKILFLKRKLSVNEEVISIYSGTDSISNITFDYLINTIETKRYWMLYIAIGQFIYIPKSAFKSQDDIMGFREILKAKGKKK